ncbi:hypothetical protein ACFHW2_19440, partial [Actinomadura sp. LOL_016]|uniref:hypothetical protein n=1 Tax=Actinomadura sp. LOL_016 TaxID=3345411 RepID=UPI003A858116
FSADGTAWETVWESRTPPDFFWGEAPPFTAGPFSFLRSFLFSLFTRVLAATVAQRTEIFFS